MKTVFMGTPDFSCSVADALEECGFEIAAVVTQPDKPAGRGMTLQASPVKKWAQQRNIPVLQPVKAREESFLQEMQKICPELVVTAAFGQILPQSVLDIPTYGCVNVHASLLPLYRGASPIQQALLEGAKETGITMMYMSAGMDEGDMILKRKIPIAEKDNAGTLFEKLAQEAKLAVKDYAQLLQQGKPKGEPQNPQEATYCKKIEKSQGNIDWTMSAQEIVNLIRAMTPFPGAYSFFRGKRIKLLQASAETAGHSELPGTVACVGKQSVAVACGDGLLNIEILQPEGKSAQAAGAFVNGYQPKIGECFERKMPENQK